MTSTSGVTTGSSCSSARLLVSKGPAPGGSRAFRRWWCWGWCRGDAPVEAGGFGWLGQPDVPRVGRAPRALGHDHVGAVDGAGVAATSRAVGPTVEGEDGPDLACHAAGLAGDVTPAVAEDCLAGDSRGIVAPQVAKRPLGGMGLTPVEFDHHPPGHISDVPVPGSAVGSILADIAQPGRQPMTALDGAAVLEFQRRGNPGFHLLQDGEETAPPSNPTALIDAGAHQVRGRQPPLRCPEHQVDGTGGRGGVARVEQRLLQPDPGRPRRRMDHRLCIGSVERASPMDAHTRLSEHPARFRNDDVDDRGCLVGEPPEPQCGAMTRRSIPPGVQQRRPYPTVRGDRAGEGRVNAR